MSEQLNSAQEVRNVDHAFDPNARTAQNDWNEYLDSRDYQDSNGKLHDAETGRFMSNPNDESEDAYYNRLQSETEMDGSFANKSLKDIAEMIKEARESGDKTLETDARTAFDDKFMETAEKYDWQGIVENADGTTTDRNAIADKKLAYYEGIMSGDSGDETPKFEAGQNVTVRRTSGEIENDWTVRSSDGEYVQVVKPAGDGDGTLVKRIPLAELRSLQETENDTNSTEFSQESAQEPAYSDQDEAMFDNEGNPTPEAAPSSADELEMIELEDQTSSADELEMIEVDNESSRRSRRQRLRDAITPAGFAAELTVLASARAERRGERTRRGRIVRGIGAAALLVGGGLLLLKGHDIFGGHGHSGGNATPDVLPGNGGGSTPSHPEIPTGGNRTGGVGYTPETVRVNPGDGEIKVTQRILEAHGFDVNSADAQRIGEHADVSNILSGDASYAHSGSTLDRIGNTGDFEVKKGVVGKLLRSAKELGIKK